ncbi:unnamed protein product, partial [marine sediment metagenome]
IAMLVANARTTKYQIPDNRYQRIKLETMDAWHLIRELQARAKMGLRKIQVLRLMLQTHPKPHHFDP